MEKIIEVIREVFLYSRTIVLEIERNNKTWTKIMKTILGLIVLVLIVICLMLAALFNGFPIWLTQLIEDFRSEIRVGLVLLTISIMASVFLFPFLFLQQAAKIHNKQEQDKNNILKQIIELNEKLEKNLDIAVVPGFASNILEINGKRIRYLTLGIINNSKTSKIVEFGVDAMLVFAHQIVGNDISTEIWSGGSLLWMKEKKELIELRPADNKDVMIAFIEDKKLGVRKIEYSGSNEILFQIMLSFSGKYEGENYFRNYQEIRSVYSFPAQEQIQFTNFAVQKIPDTNMKLIEAMRIMNTGKLYISE